MPAIALRRRTEPDADDRPFHCIRLADSPQAQSPEGKQVREAAEQALRHWNERAEALVAATEHADDDSYVSVPPNRVFYVKTRYVYAGRGTPRPFGLDHG
jgi:hypothetical protein